MISKFSKSFIVFASLLIGGGSYGGGPDYFDLTGYPEMGRVCIYMLKEQLPVNAGLRDQIDSVVRENELNKARKQFKDSRATRTASSRSIKKVAGLLRNAKNSGVDVLALYFSADPEVAAPVGFSFFDSMVSSAPEDVTIFRNSFVNQDHQDHFKHVMSGFRVNSAEAFDEDTES